MPYKVYVLTLNGSAQRLTTALSLTEHAGSKAAVHISLQPDSANTAAILVGDAAIDDSTYAFRLEAPVATIPPAPYVFETAHLPFGLGDLWVKGTDTEKLRIGVVYA